MNRVLILADDLSGAADCAVAGLAAGLSAEVRLRATTTLAPGAEVVAVDLDSRSLSAPQARRVTGLAAGSVPASRHELLLYKKFDSTLRGNVGAEVAACIDALPQRRPAVVAPAFPATGRTTRQGRVFVGTTPLARTDVWQSSGMAGPADLLPMLRGAGLATHAVALEVVRGPADRLRAALEGQRAAGVDALVFDAETDDDLRRIALAALALHPLPLLAGSAGLARQIVRAIGPATDAPAPRWRARPPAGPVLIAVGSMAPVSRQQAARLAEAEPRIVRVGVDARTLDGGPAAAAWGAAAAQLRGAVALGRDTLVQIEAGAAADTFDGRRVVHALARLLVPSLPAFGALIATGGETARALLDAFGVDSLHLADEPEPGVVLGFADRPHALAVVTKAGAFGRPNTLLDTWRHLRAGRLPRHSGDPPADPPLSEDCP